MYHKCAWCLKRPEEGVGSPRTGAIDGCESYRFWKQNSGLLQEQQVLSAAEPSSVVFCLFVVCLFVLDLFFRLFSSFVLHSPSPCMNDAQDHFLRVWTIPASTAGSLQLSVVQLRGNLMSLNSQGIYNHVHTPMCRFPHLYII